MSLIEVGATATKQPVQTWFANTVWKTSCLFLSNVMTALHYSSAPGATLFLLPHSRHFRCFTLGLNCQFCRESPKSTILPLATSSTSFLAWSRGSLTPNPVNTFPEPGTLGVLAKTISYIITNKNTRQQVSYGYFSKTLLVSGRAVHRIFEKGGFSQKGRMGCLFRLWKGANSQSLYYNILIYFTMLVQMKKCISLLLHPN